MSCRRHRTTSRALGLALLAIVISSVACGVTDEVGGVWENRFSPVQLVAGAQAPRLLDGAYVQLVLGQYGAEVAGVVRFFTSPDFTIELCPCAYVSGGRMSGGVLRFAFQACAVSGEEGGIYAELVLAADQDEASLSGSLHRAGASEPYATLTLFGRQEDRISADLKRCEPSEWRPPVSGTSEITDVDGGAHEDGGDVDGAGEDGVGRDGVGEDGVGEDGGSE